MPGLYIHIPFCKSRCTYCGFFSTTQSDLRQAYVEALLGEMLLAPSDGQTVETVYLGGGTPSWLAPEQLQRLLDGVRQNYPLAPDAEVTVECNPDDVATGGPLLDLLARGVGQGPLRVSMGAQTFDNQRLAQMGRRHTAEQVEVAVRRLRQAGVENLSLDLMYGFPHQDLRQWEADIQRALGLRPDHLSAYCLSYEEGTPLWRQLQRGEIAENDEETERQMYYTLVDLMAQAGFEHYEISNFALPGRRSRHNSSYWHDVPYIGLGAGAHEYTGRERRWNCSDLQPYIAAIGQGRRPQEAETIDPTTRYNEAVMLRLRTADGLPLDLLPTEMRRYCLQQATPFVRQGLLLRRDDRLVLSREGLFLSDMIARELMAL